MRRFFLHFGICLMILLTGTSRASDIVVLSETPVAEFTLPGGSVLKNAYVWRRSSAGLMIIHDGGQHFLNFQTLPDDWKAAYLGLPEEPEAGVVEEVVEVVVSDRHKIETVLGRIPGLTDASISRLLEKGGGEENEMTALSLALFHSLVKGDKDRATRYYLIIEERDFKISEISEDKLFSPCKPCGAKGEYEQSCLTCEGYGKCVECAGTGLKKEGLGKGDDPCEACEESGDCPDCEGKRKVVRACSVCKGRGRLVKTKYSEVNRDYLVRVVNAETEGQELLPLSRVDESGVPTILNLMPDLNEEALDFYVSNEYAGGADEMMLVAGVMWSLLKENYRAAEQFKHMLDVYFPESKLMKVQDYLLACSECKELGKILDECPKCEDGKKKGQCVECEGSGKSTEALRGKGACPDCEGLGICSVCKGEGKAFFRCKECDGRGTLFSELRAEVKFELMAGDLNEFHDRAISEEEMPDEASIDP